MRRTIKTLFLIFYVFFLLGIEKPFTGKEKMFCVLEYAQTKSNKTVQHAFVRESVKLHQLQCRSQKVQGGRLSVQSKRIWTTTSIGRGGRARSRNIFAKPQEVHKKSMSGKSDSSKDSLACHKEMLTADILQCAARSGLKDR